MKDERRRSAGHDPARDRTRRAWTFGLCGVSLAAVGVIVGALLPWPEADPTQAAAPAAPASSAASPPPSSTPPTTPKAPKIVEEPFDPAAAIPGCSTVEQPESGGGTRITRLSSGTPSYDNPRFPWFNGPKATAMSNAVASLLPSGATIDFASTDSSLTFGPILDRDPSASQPQGSTIASGSVTNGDARGSVFLTVQKTSAPAGPCVAGQLDARRTLSDGTIVDVHDTWGETDGVRTYTRSADATTTDGSRITANADDSVGNTQQEHSATVPLTVDDLARIVADPRLRVSTPVPPGTASPAQSCGAGFFGPSNGPAVTREQARRLDEVLASIDLGGRQPAPLEVADGSSSTLCTTVPSVNGTPALEITITGGQDAPPEPRPDPASGAGNTWRKLPDGTVVQAQGFDTVIVTRPGGTRVSVSTDGAPPTPATSSSALESIALTPGLEL